MKPMQLFLCNTGNMFEFFNDFFQVIVPPSSVTDASGGDAEGVKAKKPRIISLKKIKETLLAAEASDVRVAKNGSQCAGGKQRPTIKLSKLKKKENIIKIATVAAEEMKAKAKLVKQ